MSWSLVGKTRAQGLIEVRKYVSETSGLKVTIADAQGPMVHAFLCFATEADTHEGLPHTLEHLCFMGSKKYPYKGVLDLLANRCLASGTNAWTDTDHTAYTLSTAGEDGMLLLLPIYLDHVMRPMLTESQFMTEVHHITGDGRDAGVVYCEMQEQESKMYTMTARALTEAIFPPSSGYHYETGGRLEDIRGSSVERVREYHKKFYRPENLNIIVVGPVEHDHLVSVIKDFEAELIENKVYSGTFPTPFQAVIPPLEESAVIKLDCPADDDTKGLVRVGWTGPAIKKTETVLAYQVLLEYLTDTAISPIQAAFIQIPEPRAACACATLDEFRVCSVHFCFTGVPVEVQDQIEPLLGETLQRIIDGTDPIDLERMKNILRSRIRLSYSTLETNPASYISRTCIDDFLYGEEDESFKHRMNDVLIYKAMKAKNADYWRKLLEAYANPVLPHVTVFGVPSLELVQSLADSENERLEQRRKELGENGLEALGTRLAKATEENDSWEPPAELVKDVVVNSVASIDFVHLKASSSLSLEEDSNPDFPLCGLPFTTMLDQVDTNFVRLTMMLDTGSVPRGLRPFLLVWQHLLFESPMRLPNGDIQPYEDVVKDMSGDLLDYSAYVGLLTSAYTRYAVISVKVHSEEYEVGISYLRKFLGNIIFDEERVVVQAQRLAGLAASQKRDGSKMCHYLHSHLLHTSDSNPNLISILRQEDFLNKMANEPGKTVGKLEALHAELAEKARFSLHVTCLPARVKENSELPDLSVPLATLHPNPDQTRPSPRKETEPLYYRGGGRKAVVMALGASEAAHFTRTAESIQGLEHEDLAPLMVFLQYLTQCEGPLWREIRGKGLAYGASMDIVADGGLLALSLDRATDPVKAYMETKGLVEKYLSGEWELEKLEFQGAKRSLIFEIIAREDSVFSASFQSLLSYFRKVPSDYNRRLCSGVWKVSGEEALAAGRRWVTKLFDPAAPTLTALVCHPNNLDEILAGFAEISEPLEIMSLDDEELFLHDEI